MSIWESEYRMMKNVWLFVFHFVVLFILMNVFMITAPMATKIVVTLFLAGVLSILYKVIFEWN